MRVSLLRVLTVLNMPREEKTSASINLRCLVIGVTFADEIFKSLRLAVGRFCKDNKPIVEFLRCILPFALTFKPGQRGLVCSSVALSNGFKSTKKCLAKRRTLSRTEERADNGAGHITQPKGAGMGMVRHGKGWCRSKWNEKGTHRLWRRLKNTFFSGMCQEEGASIGCVLPRASWIYTPEEVSRGFVPIPMSVQAHWKNGVPLDCRNCIVTTRSNIGALVQEESACNAITTFLWAISSWTTYQNTYVIFRTCSSSVSSSSRFSSFPVPIVRNAGRIGCSKTTARVLLCSGILMGIEMPLEIKDFVMEKNCS